MSGLEGALVVLGLFVLRLAIPLAITLVIGYLLRRFLVRGQVPVV